MESKAGFFSWLRCHCLLFLQAIEDHVRQLAKEDGEKVLHRVFLGRF